MFRLRPRLTFANVVSVIALFVALGGGAYAAFSLPKNSVGTKQIKNGAVTTKKIKNGAVTTKKIKNGAVTGMKVKASTLGTVPNATHALRADRLSASEPWHQVGAPGEPGFQSSCGNTGFPYSTVAFFKDHEGLVHLKGHYHCPSAAAAAFQLPAGYRPAVGEVEQFPLAHGASAGAFVNILGTSTPFGANGKVGCTESDCVLDGIALRAAS